MLTVNLLREQSSFVIERLKIKNYDAAPTVSLILDLDRRRRELQSESDAILAELNNLSKQIGALMKEGRKDEAEAAKSQIASMKEKQKQLSESLATAEAEMKTEIIRLPNLPHSSVPPGKSAEDNITVRSGGEVPLLHEGAQPHWDLIKKYDIIDFDLGIKLTGAGFPVYKGKGAKLQRALDQLLSG